MAPRGTAASLVCICLLAVGCGGSGAVKGGASDTQSTAASATTSPEARRIEAPCVVAQRRLRALVRGVAGRGLPRIDTHRLAALKVKLERAAASAYAIEAATLRELRAESVAARYRPGLEELITRMQGQMAGLRALRARLGGESALGAPLQTLYELGEDAEGCRVYRSPIA